MTVIDRVTKEKTKLDKKLMKLHMFMNGESYISLGSGDRNLLYRQYELMDKYSCILRDRLLSMKKDTK